MKNFKKIIMPGKLPCGKNGAMHPAHFSITYTDGNLSIMGVIGAHSNGDCWGGAGQCMDALKDTSLVLTDGWTKEGVEQLYDVWERWHLNDMRPECEHQRAAGWCEKAQQKVTLYHWRLTSEALNSANKAKKAALDALEAEETFTPTAEQTRLAALPYLLTTHTAELDAEYAPYYEAKKPIYAGDMDHTETKMLGWLTQEQHPEGLLSRACPVCGYKYGSAWLYEEVPENVVTWLHDLPSARVPCAWNL